MCECGLVLIFVLFGIIVLLIVFSGIFLFNLFFKIGKLCGIFLFLLFFLMNCFIILFFNEWKLIIDKCFLGVNMFNVEFNVFFSLFNLLLIKMWIVWNEWVVGCLCLFLNGIVLLIIWVNCKVWVIFWLFVLLKFMIVVVICLVKCFLLNFFSIYVKLLIEIWLSYLVVDKFLEVFICILSGLLCIKLKLCFVLFNCGEEMLRLSKILLILFVKFNFLYIVGIVEKVVWKIWKCGFEIVLVFLIVWGLWLVVIKCFCLLSWERISWECLLCLKVLLI